MQYGCKNSSTGNVCRLIIQITILNVFRNEQKKMSLSFCFLSFRISDTNISYCNNNILALSSKGHHRFETAKFYEEMDSILVVRRYCRKSEKYRSGKQELQDHLRFRVPCAGTPVKEPMLPRAHTPHFALVPVYQTLSSHGFNGQR